MQGLSSHCCKCDFSNILKCFQESEKEAHKNGLKSKKYDLQGTIKE